MTWKSLFGAFLAVAIIAFFCGAYLGRMVFCDQELRPALDAQHNYVGVVTYCVIPTTVTYR